MPTQTKDDSDSDSDVEFEDVLPQSNQNGSSHSTWTPTLILPNQRPRPVDPGSEDEIQLRGRLTSGIDRITYRQMKADMSMDAPNTPSTHRRYDSFKELAADLEGMVDMLWASATPSIQVEGLITLAGILEMALKTYPFDPECSLGLLHKFDSVFEALCTGFHPLTHAPLPGSSEARQLVTQTQKVRIRSLAEMTRNKVFSLLSGSDDDDLEPWLLEATKVYDKTLMLLADHGEVAEWNWR